MGIYAQYTRMMYISLSLIIFCVKLTGLKLVVVGATLLPEHLYILNDKIVLPEDYDVIGEDGD
jgi:hypothetical protein